MAENLNLKGNKFCLNHLKEKIKFLCEDCKEKICINCASTTHKGHNLIGIKLLAHQKYSKLQDLNNDIQKNKIPRVRNTLQAAEQSVKKIKKEINANIQTAVTQGERLKELIDKSTAETVSELEAIKTKLTKQLEKFKADSEAVIERLEDLMKESTEVTKSDNNILIVDVEEQMSTLNVNEPQFVCDITTCTVKFVQGPDPECHIKTALGTIVYEQLQPTIPTKRFTLREPVISKLQDLSFEPWSIQRTKQGALWISGYGSKVLNRANTDGSTSALTLDTPIRDICLDSLADQLYCTPRSYNSIRTVDTQSGKTTKLFTTKPEPYCLNVTNNGHTFIVGTCGEREVTLYDRNGTVLQTVNTVRYPDHIAVCRSTGKVAIACNNGGLMVMENKSDRLHHMYTYPTPGSTIHATDAEFDGAGHLLVTDYYNNEIHIADAATGKTLKKIKVVGNPACLTTQKNAGLAFCTRYPNQLMTIKYLG